MIAYKGFNGDLTCTMGNGRFQYEIGHTYTNDKAGCGRTGYHCVEEPIEVLSWYPAGPSRYCMVDAAGDISEDGFERIACTEIKILKEITLQQLGILECKWQQDHPNRTYSKHVKRNSGMAKENGIVVVRGKQPKAAGQIGSTIFLLREEKDTHDIAEIGVFQIDGEEYKPDVYYRVDGRRSRCKRKS